MTHCKKCDNKAGLSILLVRPGAIAKDADFAPAEAVRLQSHDASAQALGLPAPDMSRNILRMLRRGGFVYAYYTRKPRQLAKPWQAFRVQDKGVLIPESEIAWDDAQARFACSAKESHPHDLRTLCVQLPLTEPESAGPVWIGFSMNWWDDGMRAKVQRNPAAAGMVCIDPLADLGGVAHAFKADARSIRRYVADFALRSMNHGGTKAGINLTVGGTDPATPFYDGDGDKTVGESDELQAVMQRQAAGHPATRGKEFVLVLPDPVGYCADLNGIRLAKDAALKKEWLSDNDAMRAQACHSTLEGLHQAILTMALHDSRRAGARCSEDRWKHEQIQVNPRYPAAYHAWVPDADGGRAADGSRNGRIVATGALAERQLRFDARQGEQAAQRKWERILGQLDRKKYQAWPARRDAIVERQAQALRPYEQDWLRALKSPQIARYFECHFDENDAGKLTARFASGIAYADEAGRACHPQPLAHQDDLHQWLELTLGKDIAAPDAFALRAFFGNQKSVIEQAKALLVGDWDRGNDGNMRDKTIDLMRGVLTQEWGQRFNWLHPRVVALSLGGLAAMVAGAMQTAAIAARQPAAPPPAGLARWLARLPTLTLAQQAMERALVGARSRDTSALVLPVLLTADVDAPAFLQFVRASTMTGAEKRAATQATRSGDGTRRFRIMVLTDAQTAIDVHEHRIAVANLGGTGQGQAATIGTPRANQRIAGLEAQARRLGTGALDAAELKDLADRVHTVRELPLASVELRLATGALFVQGLGLYQGLKQLNAQWDRLYRDDDKVTEAALGAADSLGGSIGALAEMGAAAHKSLLLKRPGGLALVEASGSLATLRSVAAFTGAAGGIINACLMYGQATGAREKGDIGAFRSYRVSMLAFTGTTATSTFALADAVGANMASRALAFLLLRYAGVEVAATAVGSAASGIGLVLLLTGVAGIVVAAALERDALERWAGGCYFGGDTPDEPGVSPAKKRRFTSAIEEAAALELIFDEPEATADRQRLERRHPMPPALPPGTSIDPNVD